VQRFFSLVSQGMQSCADIHKIDNHLLSFDQQRSFSTHDRTSNKATTRADYC
jgi:hypothetical protein